MPHDMASRIEYSEKYADGDYEYRYASSTVALGRVCTRFLAGT